MLGGIPASLIWGAIADSTYGPTGAWLAFGFLPLLILPIAIVMIIRLTPEYIGQRTVQHGALRLMAQVSFSRATNFRGSEVRGAQS